MTATAKESTAPSGTAALRMYDLLQIRPAADELWGAISRRLDQAPASLTWTGEYDQHWLAPDLVLGQTCTLPLVTTLAGRVTPVGSFRYRDVESSPGARYRSLVVARTDRPLADLGGRIGAVSSFHSTSGWLSLAVAMAEVTDRRPVLGDVVLTGGHRGSLELLQQGAVDVASIDRVTFRLFERHHPDLVAGLAVVGDGPLVPTLPLISACRDPAPIRSAIAGALTDDALAGSLTDLMIEDFLPLEESDLESVLRLAERAEEAIPRTPDSDVVDRPSDRRGRR